MMRFRFALQICALFVLLASTCSSLSAQATLNLSHDLVTNGIANQDMGRTAGSRLAPLLEAAIGYALKNGITTLTADPATTTSSRFTTT